MTMSSVNTPRFGFRCAVSISRVFLVSFRLSGQMLRSYSPMLSQVEELQAVVKPLTEGLSLVDSKFSRLIFFGRSSSSTGGWLLLWWRFVGVLI